MAYVASRELRNDTAGVLRRAAAGEPLEITVNGKAVARLVPIGEHRSSWMPRSRLTESLARVQADPGLARDLAILSSAEDDPGPIA